MLKYNNLFFSVLIDFFHRLFLFFSGGFLSSPVDVVVVGLVARELGEGLVQLVGDGLVFLLLVDELVFESVDFLL